MQGKILKIKMNNLEFGSQDKYVNILGYFKYKNNSNTYILYSNKNTSDNAIYYGSGHLGQGVAICMAGRDKTKDEEIIKEYISKITKKETMDNFEMISLDTIEAIEIISFTRLEIDHQIIKELNDIVIPKEESKEDINKVVSKQKKNPVNIICILLVICIIIGVFYYLFFGNTEKKTILKNITCTKNYQHNTLIATVEETNKYNFDINNELVNIDTTMLYQFNSDSYQDFMLNGTYYKYMPSSDTEGGWDKNDEEYTFKVITKKYIDIGYNEPTNYQDVLSHYKTKGYTCIEETES